MSHRPLEKPPGAARQDIFPLATRAEADLIRGRAALEARPEAEGDGFDPELIIGHPGWGETVFLDETLPEARSILFPSTTTTAAASTSTSTPSSTSPTDEKILVGYAKNATMALAYSEADAIVCPTPFQAATLPETSSAWCG